MEGSRHASEQTQDNERIRFERNGMRFCPLGPGVIQKRLLGSVASFDRVSTASRPYAKGR